MLMPDLLTFSLRPPGSPIVCRVVVRRVVLRARVVVRRRAVAVWLRFFAGRAVLRRFAGGLVLRVAVLLRRVAIARPHRQVGASYRVTISDNTSVRPRSRWRDYWTNIGILSCKSHLVMVE